MTLRPLSLAILFAAAVAPPALAQEIVRAGAGGAPPEVASAPDAASAQADAQSAHDRAIGEWGRRVLAGASTADVDAPPQAAAAKGCGAGPANDGKPHGQVWAGIGTRGYREVGGVVTQPLGQCGSLTIAVDRTEGPHGRR